MVKLQHKHLRSGKTTVRSTAYHIDEEGCVEVSEEHAAILLQGKCWREPGKWPNVASPQPLSAEPGKGRRVRTKEELLGLADLEGVPVPESAKPEAEPAAEPEPEPEPTPEPESEPETKSEPELDPDPDLVPWAEQEPAAVQEELVQATQKSESLDLESMSRYKLLKKAKEIGLDIPKFPYPKKSQLIELISRRMDNE